MSEPLGVRTVSKLNDPTQVASPRPRTVRDATFDVFRRFGMTTIFANPGSTEMPFLAGLPDDLGFVLALHEGSVVGMATGYARRRGARRWSTCTPRPGWATPSVRSRPHGRTAVPLVVVVGQQDRRHLV